MTENTIEIPKYHYFGHGEQSGRNIISALRREVAPLRFKIAAKAVVRELGITPEDKVLEIGCGVGLLGEAIKERVGSDLKYYGMDLNYDPALTDSKRRGLSPIRGDAINLPFPDGSFDEVVSTDVFEHVDNAKKLVSETYRVLRPEGKAFIVIADPFEGRFNVSEDHIARSDTGSDVGFWTDMFKSQGFEILEKSERYRKSDLRRVFNLPLLRKIKNKPFLSCAFRIVNRPGVYILEKV